MESTLVIYDNSGSEIIIAPVTRESVRKRVLMADNYLLLAFNHSTFFDFKKGCYVMYNNFRFEIMTDVTPESLGNGWKYSLKFEAEDGCLKKYSIVYRGQDVEEFVFALTSDLLSFGNIICDCINHDIGGNNWSVKAIPSEFADSIKTLSFKGEKLFDAATMIANEFKCEWWTEENGSTINICFGKLAFGAEEILKSGDAVKSISLKSGNDSSFGTRFYVFGSSRNLTPDYGQVSQGGTTNHISEVRLRLPNGMNYIDAWDNLSPKDVVHQVVFFDDIYPKNTDIVTKVDTVDRAIQGGGTFKAYIITASNTPFLPSDIIKGETLECIFESGALQGRTFELKINYDPDTWKPLNGFDKKFEIVHSKEGDIIIPNESFNPIAGDKFIITGVKLSSARILEAEQELLEAGRNLAQEKSRDTSICECPTNPVYCYENNKDYEIGQKVNLVDGSRFGTGRNSRIQGYEKKLWNPYEATYTVGDNPQYSRLGSIEGDIKASQYSERIGVTSGAGIYLIRDRFDNTQTTNYNAYSSLASIKKFATNVLFHEHIDQPVRVKDNVEFNSVTSEEFTSEEFTSGLLGVGHRIWNGILELDEIIVRKAMHVFELIIQKISSVNGSTLTTPGGGMRIAQVEELGVGYKCFFNNDKGSVPNPFVVGDQLLRQVFTGKEIGRYWRLVTEIGDDYFVLSKTDCEAESGVPEANDEVVQFGNRTDRSRQSGILTTSYGVNAPYTAYYSGVNSYSLSGKEVLREGNLDGIVDADLGQLTGFGLYAKNAYLRGKLALSSGKTVENTLGEIDTKTDTAQSTGESAQQVATAASAEISTTKAELTKVTSDVKLLADAQSGFSVSVSEVREKADAAQSAVDNLQIGGVNIFDNTQHPDLSDSSIWNLTAMSGVYGEIASFTAIKITGQWARLWQVRDDFKAGQEYTFSCYVKRDSTLESNETRMNIFKNGGDIQILKCTLDGLNVGTGGINGATGISISPDKFQYLTFTFKSLVDTDGSYIRIEFYTEEYQTNNPCGVVYGYMMEEGNKATSWKPSISDVNKEIELAQTAADEAKERLAAMSSDGIISKEEKATLRNSLSQVDKEFASYQKQAIQYGVSIAALQTAYNTLVTFLTNIVLINQDSDFTFSAGQKDIYNNDFADYYSERTAFANLIAKKVADGAVDNLQIGGVNLFSKTNTKQGGIDHLGGLNFISQARIVTIDKIDIGSSRYITISSAGEYSFNISGYNAAGEHISPVSENITRIWTPISTPFLVQIKPDIEFIRVQFVKGDWDNVPFPLSELDQAKIKVEIGNKATDWSPSIADTQSEINIAQQLADSAMLKLLDWASDSKISPTEKTALKQQHADIQSEFAEINTNATNLNLKSQQTWLDYNSAYNSAIDTITKYTAALPESIDIASDYAMIANYYPFRQGILNSISSILSKGKVITIIDASGLDQSKYYPLTICLQTGIRSQIKIHAYMGISGVPCWATHVYGFSCECSWEVNGAGWGTTNTNRYVDSFSYSWTMDNITPIGDIGQMGKSNNEFVYVRGGGIYTIETTNAQTPTLRTSDFTAIDETIQPRSSVTVPEVSVDAVRTELTAKITVLNDSITNLVTKTEYNAVGQRVSQTEGNITTLSNRIDLKVSSSDFNALSNKVVTCESSITLLKNRISLLVKTGNIETGLVIKPECIEISGATIFRDSANNQTFSVFGSGGYALNLNNKFKVTTAGKLYATDAEISGTINAVSGKIGQFIIENGSLKSSNLTLSSLALEYIDNSGNAMFGGYITGLDYPIGFYRIFAENNLVDTPGHTIMGVAKFKRNSLDVRICENNNALITSGGVVFKGLPKVYNTNGWDRMLINLTTGQVAYG